MGNRITAATAEEYDKNTKEQLGEEVSARIQEGSPSFTALKSDATKPFIILALLEDDKLKAAKTSETAEAKSGGKAVAIPVVKKKELAVVEAHNPPGDHQFTFLARRDVDKQLYAVAVHEPNTYGRTHTAKNSESYWDGTMEQFRTQFVVEK